MSFYNTQSIANYNAVNPADDGTDSAANEILLSREKEQLADPIRNLLDAINNECARALNTQTRFKIGSFTRDVSTATGTQAVTGVSFQPKSIKLLACINATAQASWGFDDGTNAHCTYSDHNTSDDTYNVSATKSIYLEEGGGAYTQGVIDSFDEDGFTISWTKNGSPTGTATVLYLAFL